MNSIDIASIDIQHFTKQCFPGFQTSILKEISGGQSGAAVLLIDIAVQDESAKAANRFQPGQYILKVQYQNPWPGEAQESERHSEATSRSSEFATAHIPALRYSETIDGVMLLLYEVAGQSMASFVSANTVDAISLRHYCTMVSADIWFKWNGNYSINTSTSARTSLQRWLGYRLDRTKASQLHSFVASECEGKSVFRMADRVLLNPLFAAASSHTDIPVASVSFDGMIHGDLHLGNIIVNRTLKQKDQYWLIDFALANATPLGFDQAYLELSILIGLLQGVEPQRIFNILEALESPDDIECGSRVPVSDVGILESCRVIRQANSTWQKNQEPKRTDSVTAQCLLSRIAAGLNWANKPLPTSKRRLALAYSAWAATRYYELFISDQLEIFFTDHGRPKRSIPPPITPAWPEVWAQLGRFDSTKAKYVLIANQLDVSKELRSLALIPWSAIIDLDPNSNERGLYSAIAKTLTVQRSVNQYGLDSIPIDADRGTSWFMAYGWPSRQEPVPQDFRRWRSEYGARCRQLFRELRRAAAPLPVKVVILASDEIDKRVLQSLIAMADESLETSSDITLISLLSSHEDPAVKAHYSLAVNEFIRAVYQVFGASVQVDEPTIPGSDGLMSLAIDQLRNWEEDLSVLHSKILEQASITDGAIDAFWKGNPPSWSDLHADFDVRRDLGPKIIKKVSDLLHAWGNYTVELRHAPGSGGTTAALRCGWDLRRDFPVTVLRCYSSTTADRIDQIFRISQKPVLLIADASLLPPANREKLYRDIAQRNVRCVILYVVRSFETHTEESKNNPLTNRLEITDPMVDDEAKAFLRAFLTRTKNPKRQQFLIDLAEQEQWKPYRTPFFFGLITYEEEFESVQSYVEHHLSEKLADSMKKVVRFLALVTKYSQTGISIGLTNDLLGLDPASDIELRDALGEIIERLIVRRGQVLRLLHPVIAQEVLRQSLGDRDWKYGLRDLCLEFIAETAEFLGSDSEDALHLFFELFIRRDYWAPFARLRRNFSDLILDIPTPAGQHQVLLALTNTCPQEPHFWNHLGRHHIYEMKQDFTEAENYLTKATELDPNEQVHHHALGMVRRFSIRSLMSDLLQHESSLTADFLFETIFEKYSSASEEFAIARKLGPEDNHGYITHIQLILEILENLVRLDTGKTLPSLLSKESKVGDWARASVVRAEDLLRQVQHLRESDKPSRYELSCTNALANLYGHFDAVISSLETLSKSVPDSDVRRALATAYYSKSGRVWANYTDSELRRTKKLMEDNLRADPTNEHDIRYWFQAFRRLPEFSYIDAIDRLEGWAKKSNQVDAYYYLYILHFLRWLQGAERNENATRASLDQCRQHAIGKRGYAYEWLAKEPPWCPLVQSRELGDWKDFWINNEPLEWVTGSIASIKPQAGTIRLGAQTVAHFVPGTKFLETRHINTLVKCHIGFSYEGLRAWSVEFVDEDSSIRFSELATKKKDADNAIRSESVIKQELETFSRDSYSTELADSNALARRVERFIQDQLTTSINRKKPLYLSGLGSKLDNNFGKRLVLERLGFNNFVDLLLSIPSIEIVGKGASKVVVRSHNHESEGVVERKPLKHAAIKKLSEAQANDLSEEIRTEVLKLLSISKPEKGGISLALIGQRLIKRFGLPLTYQRLGFPTLKQLIESYNEFVIDTEGNVFRASS